MLEYLFTALFDSEERLLARRRPRKGVLVGAGQIGMACAYSMLIQNTLDEIVLVDVNQEKLKGEVMDLAHGLPFVEPSLVKVGTLADGYGDGADIVVITAGAIAATRGKPFRPCAAQCRAFQGLNSPSCAALPGSNFADC